MKFITKIHTESQKCAGIYCYNNGCFFLFFRGNTIEIYKQTVDNLFLFKEIKLEYVISEVKRYSEKYYLNTESNIILECSFLNLEIAISRKVMVGSCCKLVIIAGELFIATKNSIINVNNRDIILVLDYDILQVETAGKLLYILGNHVEKNQTILCAYQYDTDHTVLKTKNCIDISSYLLIIFNELVLVIAENIIQVFDITLKYKSIPFNQKVINYTANEYLILLTINMEAYQFDKGNEPIFLCKLKTTQQILLNKNMIVAEDEAWKIDIVGGSSELEHPKKVKRQSFLHRKPNKSSFVLKEYDYNIRLTHPHNLHINESMVIVDLGISKYVYQYGIFTEALGSTDIFIVLKRGVIREFVGKNQYMFKLDGDNEIFFFTEKSCYIYSISYDEPASKSCLYVSCDHENFNIAYENIGLYSYSGKNLSAFLTRKIRIEKLLKYKTSLTSSKFLEYKGNLVVFDNNVVRLFDTFASKYKYIQFFKENISGCYVSGDLLYVAILPEVRIFRINMNLTLDLGLKIDTGAQNVRLEQNVLLGESSVYIFHKTSLIRIPLLSKRIIKYTGKYLYYSDDNNLFCKNIEKFLYERECVNFSSVYNQGIPNRNSNIPSRLCSSNGNKIASYAILPPTKNNTLRYYTDDLLFAFSYKENILSITKDNVLSMVRDDMKNLKYVAKIESHIICFYERYASVFLIGIKHLVLKSEQQYFCFFKDIQIIGRDIYLCTQYKSIFKYLLDGNKLILSCSDPSYREIKDFQIYKQDTLFLYEKFGYISIIKDSDGIFIVIMRMKAGEISQYYISPTSVHYKLENGSICEIRHVSEDFFELAYALMDSKQHNYDCHNVHVLPDYGCNDIFSKSMNLRTNSYEKINTVHLRSVVKWFYQNHKEWDISDLFYTQNETKNN